LRAPLDYLTSFKLISVPTIALLGFLRAEKQNTCRMIRETLPYDEDEIQRSKTHAHQRDFHFHPTSKAMPSVLLILLFLILIRHG
jgi:hypothetical protein